MKTYRSLGSVEKSAVTRLPIDGFAGVVFITETLGLAVPDGHTVMKPAQVELSAVMFSVTAFAVAGTPQFPRTGKSRCVPSVNIGPPVGPFGLRVSTMRQRSSG